jgi:hypothetical protein
MAVPAGISISGCYRNPAANYCNGQGFGLKITDVASITLQPQTVGVSLAFGQTQQASSPTALTCKGMSATVSTYTYGTTNNRLVDISPTGNICAGTWNRNSGGGIPNYTICNFPNPPPNTNGLPYGIAYITASGNAVTSNPVEVYVHAAVTSVSLVGPTQCVSQLTSQNSPSPLDSQACYSAPINGAPTAVEFCAPASITKCPYGSSDPRCNNPSKYFACQLAPGVTSVPTCTSSIGTLSYSSGTSSVATINQENNTITAELPGTTVITASISGTGSSAGYFSTCPPKSIELTLNGESTGPVTVTQGVTQNLVTTVIDTQGNPITGLTLDYQSTNPLDLTAGSGGSISSIYPGSASIYAICQPSTCDPSPINQVGLNGTGLSIASNPMLVTTPGTASAYMWFSSPYKSQYFVPLELLTGTTGSTVRLPYVPNSMVMDNLGSNLYFGSSHALMIFTTANNTLSKQDPSVPGVVLAVAPNNGTLLINDQVRQVFYVYGESGGIQASFGGLGNAAAWTPDSKTLYITDSAALGGSHTDTLYVYNANTGWTTYPLAASSPQSAAQNPGAQNLAITVPGVGAFLSGNPTVAHTWCPSGTVGNYASMSFYPQPPDDSVDALTDLLAATTDGKHILGAAAAQDGAVTLTDIGVTVPTPAPCPVSSAGVLTPLTIPYTIDASLPLSKISATAVNQIVASPGAAPGTSGTSPTSPSMAFFTYTPYPGATSGDLLPYYVPAASGPGTLNYLTLTHHAGSPAITAPVAGAFSPDNTLFFVSTAGDNLIHYISINPGAAPTDSQQIAPNLPACTVGTDPDCTNTTVPANGPVPATAIAVKPRSTT